MIRRKNRNKIGGEDSGGDDVGCVARPIPAPPIIPILLLTTTNNLLLPHVLS